MQRLSSNDFIGIGKEPDLKLLEKTLGPASFEDLVNINVYYSPELSVFLPNGICFYAEPEHTHPGYSFVVPFSKASPFKVDGKIKTIERGRIFPLNPGQPHQGVEDFMISEYIAFCIDKDFLQNLAGELYGRPEIIFENKNFAVDGHLETLINNFIFELKNKQKGFEFVVHSLTIQIAIYLLRNLRCGAHLPVALKNYSEKQNILRAAEYIYANFDRDLSLNEIAGAACLSPFHFIRSFKKETGKTPFEYLLEVRLEKAKNLLKIKDKPISEICYDCGFSNPSHFTDIFAKKVGVPPSKYRIQIQSFISSPKAKK